MVIKSVQYYLMVCEFIQCASHNGGLDHSIHGASSTPGLGRKGYNNGHQSWAPIYGITGPSSAIIIGVTLRDVVLFRGNDQGKTSWNGIRHFFQQIGRYGDKIKM